MKLSDAQDTTESLLSESHCLWLRLSAAGWEGEKEVGAFPNPSKLEPK
jgi:hypothetical protein